MTVYFSLDQPKLSVKANFSLISDTINQALRRQSSAADELKDRILQKKARVGVLGLGYVGLPLAVEFAQAGFDVVGIDVQQSKIDQFNSGHSYVKDVKDDVFRPLVDSAKLRPTPASSASPD